MKLEKAHINKMRFEQVTFNHESHDATLQNVDFEFPSNEIIWLRSGEGAGKSTVLQILAGLLSPQSGKYLVNDEDTTNMSFEEFLPYRLNIGYSFDYGGLISNRSIFDNLLLPLVYHQLITEKEGRERVKLVLNQFELNKVKDERPAHVPGRVRKLTCLLRAVITHPDLLLMDDPSVGLGNDTATIFLDFIHELRRQGYLKHILITSYDDKFMGLLPNKELYLSGGGLFLANEAQEKKVMNL